MLETEATMNGSLIFYVDGFLCIFSQNCLVCEINAHSEHLHGNPFSDLNLCYVFPKNEEGGDDALPCRNSDPMIGAHTEKLSLKASDSMDSLYSGQSSSSKTLGARPWMGGLHSVH